METVFLALRFSFEESEAAENVPFFVSCDSFKSHDTYEQHNYTQLLRGMCVFIVADVLTDGISTLSVRHFKDIRIEERVFCRLFQQLGVRRHSSLGREKITLKYPE